MDENDLMIDEPAGALVHITCRWWQAHDRGPSERQYEAQQV